MSLGKIDMICLTFNTWLIIIIAVRLLVSNEMILIILIYIESISIDAIDIFLLHRFTNNARIGYYIKTTRSCHHWNGNLHTCNDRMQDQRIYRDRLSRSCWHEFQKHSWRYILRKLGLVTSLAGTGRHQIHTILYSSRLASFNSLIVRVVLMTIENR